MNIQKNNNLNIQNLSFRGHRKTLDKCGYVKHNFYYLYDSSKYNCELELYNIKKDEKGNFSIADKIELHDYKNGINVPDGGISLDLSNCDDINLENGFAYRFKLTDKTNKDNVSYGFDNGTVIGIFKNVEEFVEEEREARGIKKEEEFVKDKLKENGINEEDYQGSDDSKKELENIKEPFLDEHKKIMSEIKDFVVKEKWATSNKFNVVLNNRAVINKNGPMQLIMPDEYYPGAYGTRDASGRYVVQINNGKKDEINSDKKDEIDDSRPTARNAVRTHANKLGGKFAGIIYRLPEISKEGVKRIVGTPFTKDTISSHLYWTENAYQVAPTLGTENDFKALQIELFKNGINWISDAALVNEGFGGIHLTEALRKGDNGTCKNMFRAGERLSLGVLPDESEKGDKKKGFTRMKIINAPFIISGDGKKIEDNKEYKAQKPTYIQFYDSRLASDTQKKSDSPKEMATYANKNTDNVYDITKHDDAVYPFSFEVNPAELKRNIEREISQQGEVSLDSGYTNTINSVSAMKRIADFENFNIVNKEKAGGLEVWDGNVDIAKLNFYRSRQDNNSRFAKIRPSDRQAAIEAFDRGTLAVRDYAVNSGKYWTQLTADTQLQYASKLLAEKRNGSTDYMSVIEDAVKDGELPKSTLDVVDNEVINNVKGGMYKLVRLESADARSALCDEFCDNEYLTLDYVTKKAMDLPLETLPVATNLLGILTSPYLAKKANIDEELGVSRFDLSSVGNPNLPEEYRATYQQMDAVYSKIADKINDIVSNIDAVTDEQGEVTDYGRYVITEIAPDLTKYMFIKALSPNANVKPEKDGTFDFSKVNEEDITMQSLGISYNTLTSKEEAEVVLDSLNTGLDSINIDELKETVKNRFKNRTLDDFRIAEMIMDRTESGLGWRIDAAKDIAAIDSVRAEVDSIDEVWDNVIDFWKLFNQSVLTINPHAYTTAEITDLGGLYDNVKREGKYCELSPERQKARKYKSPGDAERKFLEETGITSVANYNFFFSFLPELFAPNSFEHGGVNGASRGEKNAALLGKLDDGWWQQNYDNPGFLFDSPADGVENSYTFIGNHDKPRPLHGLVLNMNLFNYDFKKLDENSVHAAIDAVKKGIPEWAWKRVFVGNDGDDALPEKFVKEGKDFLEKLEKDGTGNSIKENINLIIDCIEKVGKEYFESIGKVKDKDYLVSNAPDWRKNSLSSLEYYEIAADVLQVTKDVDGKKVLKNIDEISFDGVNAMAVAMGHRLKEAFADVLKDDNDNKPKKVDPKTAELIKEAGIEESEIKDAVAKLASGKYKDSEFDPTAFGTRPFDIAIKTVLDEVEYNRKGKIETEARKALEAEVLKNLLVPAYDRYLSMYKLLITLPGSPTDFAGDRVGISGYETKAKNYHQQNRNTIQWEWLEDPNYSFIKGSYDDVNKIANLRSIPALSALNDGATISAELKDINETVQSMIRYNNKGSVVISFHDMTGASTPLNEKMNRKENTISDSNKRVYFKKVEDKSKRGLKFGLEEGMKFVNASDIGKKDCPYYKVGCDNGSYYIEKFKFNAKEKEYEKQDITISEEDYNTLLLCKYDDVAMSAASTTAQKAPAAKVNQPVQKNGGSTRSESIASTSAKKAYFDTAQSSKTINKAKEEKANYFDQFKKADNNSNTKVHKETKLITKLFNTIISIFVNLFTLGRK